jgi:hypothetical protein
LGSRVFLGNEIKYWYIKIYLLLES